MKKIGNHSLPEQNDLPSAPEQNVLSSAPEQNVLPSAPEHEVQPIGMCGWFGCCCVFSFIVFRSMFPIWGQYRAIWICKNWNTYVQEEDEETANLELICSTYGLYGIWLLLKCLKKPYWKLWKFAVGMLVQFTDEEKSTYGKMKLWNYLTSYGNIERPNVCCHSYFREPMDIYKKNFSICEIFSAVLILTILSLGTVTIPILWCLARCFGNKFVSQHDSYFKYTLGHIYKLLSCSIFHIISFVIRKWNSPHMVDRIIANSGYFTWFPLYIIYCYFSYAYDFRYGYNERVCTANLHTTIPDQTESVVYIQSDNKSNTSGYIAINKQENKLNDVISVESIEQTSLPIANVVEIHKSNVPQYRLDRDYLLSNATNLWWVGTFMYIFGTGGLALILFAFEEMKFTPEEWKYIRNTCGFYIFYKSWKALYNTLQKNRYTCSNIFSKCFVEIMLFFVTFGVQYVVDLYHNLMCVPFEKRYTIGALQSLIFAPFFFKSHKNVICRLFAKLVLFGYNFIAYYFISVAVDYPHITIPIFVTINYPTYCIYKFVTTNKFIVTLVVNLKHHWVDTWLGFKYQCYRLKFNAINSYRNAKNNAKITWSNTKTNFRVWKANSYNQRHGLTETNPRFKIAKISVPKLSELKVFKTYETYYNKYTTKKKNRLPIKNTIIVLTAALNKIISVRNDNSNLVTLYDCNLWATRYDELLGQVPLQLVESLEFSTVVTFVNHYTQNNIKFDLETRDTEITTYQEYLSRQSGGTNVLQELIYVFSGLNKNCDNSEKIKQNIDMFKRRTSFVTSTAYNV